jgi:hypothetical protein
VQRWWLQEGEAVRQLRHISGQLQCDRSAVGDSDV